MAPNRSRFYGVNDEGARGKEQGAREGYRDPQKFSSQNEGLIADAISPRTLRRRTAHTHTDTRIHVVHVHSVRVYECSPRPLRARPRGKTSPARLHRSFASSRCFITIALGSLLSPLSVSFLPNPLHSFSLLRRAGLATLSHGKLDGTLRTARRRLRESRFGNKVASSNRNPENSPKESAPRFFSPFSLHFFLPLLLTRDRLFGEHAARRLLGAFPPTLR